MNFQKMKKPIFFLFTCVKNGRQFINKLFDSLICQTEFNFIHFIYDDGSDDPIEDLVNKYKEKVSKLATPYDVYYERSSQNIGLNMATKHCIEKCNLPYFIWIDCDNWVDCDFFKEMGNAVEKNPKAVVVRSWLKTSDGRDYCLDKRRIALSKKHYQLNQFYYGQYYYSFFAVKKEFYLLTNPNVVFINKKDFFNDTQTVMCCLHTKKHFVLCNKAVGYYYEHPSTETNNYIKKDLKSRYENYQTLLRTLDLNYKNIMPSILRLRELFVQMDYYKVEKNGVAWKCYFERLKIIDKEKIPKELKYKYGNSFSWFLKLIICFFVSLLKIIKNKIKINIKYLFFCLKTPPNIKSFKKTIDDIVKNKKSISRFGEGELRKMVDNNFLFKDRLTEAFNDRNENLIIGLSSLIFKNHHLLTKDARKFYKKMCLSKGNLFFDLVDKKYEYGDACFTRFYMDYRNKNRLKIKKYVQHLKTIWEGKDLLIVEGVHSKNGVGNDLFSNAKSIKRILCPDSKSYLFTDQIKETVLKEYKDGDLILISSGFAGTILARELCTFHNIQAIDIGNVDVEYMWFSYKCKDKAYIKGKNSAEAQNGDAVISVDYNENEYNNQIIATIS